MNPFSWGWPKPWRIYRERIIFIFFTRRNSGQSREIPWFKTLKESQDLKFDVMSLFETGIDKDFMDVEKVSQAMKAGSVTVNFIYINMETGRGMSTELKEFSTDIYNAFSKLAGTTGGIVETTSKPVMALEKVFKESQQWKNQYYLLGGYTCRLHQLIYTSCPGRQRRGRIVGLSWMRITIPLKCWSPSAINQFQL